MYNESRYFRRDISWLSFNHRVLLEAEDAELPLYERINFISIYSSNLEEFYQVRVAEHRAVASGGYSEFMTPEEAYELTQRITRIVNEQLDDRVRIYDKLILPEMRRNHIVFFQSQTDVKEEVHKEFVHRYFMEEVFPYLAPMKVEKGMTRIFLRDKRLYLAVRVRRKNDVGLGNGSGRATTRVAPTGCTNDGVEYYIIKLPYSKVPRFVELPKIGDDYYLMFIEDIIKKNLKEVFVGYDVDCSYCCKISRDADVYVDDVPTKDVVRKLKEKVKKRKIGAIARFVYDRNMPVDFLDFLIDAYSINRDELVIGDKHLNLEDLSKLPNPNPDVKPMQKPKSLRLPGLDTDPYFMYRRILKKDLLLYYPYFSFDHFTHFLHEAVNDPFCTEIMVTQYRVAEHSEVINALISAARNGKKVTVFVELKARFDEENNMATAEMMRNAGINILFSIPGLKVHAKVALVLRADDDGNPIHSFAYVSTGNFNESTAKIYSDIGLYTCNQSIVDDLHNLFLFLRKEVDEPMFKSLLIARFNLLPELKRLIHHEMELAQSGRRGRIVLKMNALQDLSMIDELYAASEAGVEIDLIVRGICCLIPGKEFSRNIRVTRIVDSFLEHARVWYFGNDGDPRVYLGSPDWMRRNLYRRIEAVTPVLDGDMRQQLIDMLRLQLRANWKACWVDSELRNVFKRNTVEPTDGQVHDLPLQGVYDGRTAVVGRPQGSPLQDVNSENVGTNRVSAREEEKKVRAQYDFYQVLKEKLSKGEI